MAVPGRPTPQQSGDERPRFRDPSPADFDDPHLNPYLTGHLEFGPPLIPASEAWPWRGRWAAQFGREAPLHLEIGSGNGFFLAEMAQRHPAWNWLGLEIRYKRTVLTAKKLVRAGVAHARILRYHAAYLDDLFEPGALAGIYVNHPDPWPKQRHHKHRLIAPWFLADVARYLAEGGWLRVKSDYRPNVQRVADILADRPDLPLAITGRSADVVEGEAPWSDDAETNYQRKAAAQGKPVHAVEVVRTEGDPPAPPLQRD